jgi:hypothetical protein
MKKGTKTITKYRFKILGITNKIKLVEAPKTNSV